MHRFEYEIGAPEKTEEKRQNTTGGWHANEEETAYDPRSHFENRQKFYESQEQTKEGTAEIHMRFVRFDLYGENVVGISSDQSSSGC